MRLKLTGTLDAAVLEDSTGEEEKKPVAASVEANDNIDITFS